MADRITLSRSVSSRPLLVFLEALLLGKAAQTPMFTLLLEKACTGTNAYSSAGEGYTDTIAY